MKKSYRGVFWLLFLPLLWLAACGGRAAEPATQPNEPTVQPTESEPVPQQVEPTVEVIPTAEPTLMPAAAKPQLIEFYAEW